TTRPRSKRGTRSGGGTRALLPRREAGRQLRDEAGRVLQCFHGHVQLLRQLREQPHPDELPGAAVERGEVHVVLEATPLQLLRDQLDLLFGEILEVDEHARLPFTGGNAKGRSW